MTDNTSKLTQPTVIKILPLFLCNGFEKCEIWKDSDYIRTHCGTKKWRSHKIASKKMDILQDIGFSSKDAQRLVIMEGSQKVNKKNLSLLGSSLVVGSVEELCNHSELWDYTVTDIIIKGITRRKLIIKVK